MANRPWWCQDPTCTPVANNVPPDASPGESGFCAGRMAETHVIERMGVRHENDCHWCFRSALRGVVMAEVNHADLEIIARNACRLLLEVKPEREFNLRWYLGSDPETKKVLSDRLDREETDDE